ncbi:hypothetical protein WMW71_04650 [Flavobacterium buctense]|uniref:Uncharacterized protein n=1 Tax=Flavobacterium buctense TaxID=1648146 RepID=A0ABU9DZ16_9FLAO|nr:hypothetical protein [Flavobacterium buctense]
MKAAFITLLFFLSLNSSSQQLVNYTIDQDASLLLPENSVVTDSVGQKMIKGTIGGVNIVFLKAKEQNTKVVLEEESDLVDFYIGFQKGYAKSVYGKIVKDKIVDVGHLKGSLFECRSKMNNLNLTIDCLVVFLNNYAYTVQFFNIGSTPADYETQKKAVISSLQFRDGLTINHQLTASVEDSMAYKIGEVVGYFIGVAVLVILIWFILKKKKDRKYNGT